jgi:regulatory protein
MKKSAGELKGDPFQVCLNASLGFLAFRPRSEAEMRERLRKKGFGEGEIEKTIAHLKKINLLDDAAFAAYWKENRAEHRPRGQRLLKAELRQKGLEREVIEVAVEDVDDAAGAYRAAQRKARSLRGVDYLEFRSKLGRFLQRRGFDFAISQRTVKQLWEEKNGVVADEDGNQTGV